jgi:hypothetical protein
MFKSPIESYQHHYGNPGDIDVVFAASSATSEAIFAIENGDKDLARQKWESVDGDKLLHSWNVGIANFKLKGKVWDEIEKPILDGPIAKPVSQSLAKRFIYGTDISVVIAICQCLLALREVRSIN